MSSIQTFPYQRPPASLIKTTPWIERGADEEHILEGTLPHWDPATPINAYRTAEIDVVGIRSACSMSPDDRLRMAVIWISPGTGLRGNGSRVDLETSDGGSPIELSLHVEGGLLADRIRIETHLVLGEPGVSDAALAPHRAGSLLWKDETIVMLEGTASRFPTELVDFTSVMRLPEGAAWFLDWDPDELDRTVLGSMRLLINMGHTAVSAAIKAAAPTDADTRIKQVIYFDVGRTMILGALNNDEFVRHANRYEDGTVGASIRRLIRTLFPDYETYEGLQQYRKEQPFFFECDLQARLRLFHER